MQAPRLLPLGPVAVSAQPWRYRGRTQLAVVAKVTFALPPKGAAEKGARTVLEVADPEPIQIRDTTIDDHPIRSLADCTDLVPYLPRGEAILVGAAYVPRGGRAACRFAIARAGAMIFDRRVWAKPPDGAAGDLVRVPIVYESACGGPGFADNPMGSDRPLLTDARDPAVPGAFGPVASFVRSRAYQLKPDDKKALGAPLLELRDDFPWDYFLAAPPSQRAPRYFAGDEVILLEHVSPKHERLELALPGVNVVARAHDGALGEPFPLAADFLRVDAERLRVSLTFRASMPMSADARYVIAARASIPGRPDPAWPSDAEWVKDGASQKRAVPKTQAMSLSEFATPKLPFAERPASPREDRASSAAPVPGAPFGAPAAPAPQVGSTAMKETLELGTPKVRPPAVSPPLDAMPTAAPVAAVAMEEKAVPILPVPPGLIEFGLLPLGSADTEEAPRRRAPASMLGAALIRAVAARAKSRRT